jgi:hypothetical protein
MGGSTRPIKRFETVWLLVTASLGSEANFTGLSQGGLFAPSHSNNVRMSYIHVHAYLSVN